MYRPLAPCPGCARHVRVSEARCPFCATPLPAAFPGSARPDAPPRLSRAARLAFGAAIAVGVVLPGCAREASGTDGAPGDSAPAADSPLADNAPPPADTAVVRDTGEAPDEGTVVAAYGGPFPFDATANDASDVPDDEGGNVFLYGAPAPPDVNFPPRD